MIPAITDAHRRALDTDGFFVLEDVFNRDEVDGVAERIDVHHQAWKGRVQADPSIGGLSSSKQIFFTGHLAEQDERLREFCTRPEFVAIAAALFGPDVDLYWNQSVFKEPEGDAVFPWHQDDSYAQVTNSPYLTCWLALNDATLENGCISVLPGRWKQGLLRHGESPYGWSCHSNEDPDQGVPVPVRAGSMAVFWSLTPHKSGANRSKGVRKAYVIQYTKSGTRLVSSGEPVGRIPLARGGRAATQTAAFAAG